jgi:hypothetical protein
MHTIQAGWIRTGGYHPAFVWPASHSEGFTAQLGIAQFLDSAEKRIQIKVQDFSLTHTTSLHIWANQVNRYFFCQISPYSSHL